MQERAMPDQVERPPESITLWVIFDHPRNYPHGYVLRPQFSVKRFDGMERFGRIVEDHGNEVVIVSPRAWFGMTAVELRAILPRGTFRIPTSPGDDPAISEIWME
jgi:hypothetical protein